MKAIWNPERMGAALETEPERLSPKVSLHLLDSPENRRVCCGKTQKQDYGQFMPSRLQQHTHLWAALNIHPDVVCTCETEECSLPPPPCPKWFDSSCSCSAFLAPGHKGTHLGSCHPSSPSPASAWGSSALSYSSVCLASGSFVGVFWLSCLIQEYILIIVLF